MSFRRKRRGEPGEKRAARIKADRLRAAAWRLGLRRTAEPRSHKDATGLKRQYVPGSEFEGTGVLTPYFTKALRRRRAANKVAKRSRKVNR